MPKNSAPTSTKSKSRREILPKSYRRAIIDVYQSFQRRELWIVLGIQDIKQRYRRSVLGPLWITIAAGISSLAMGLLYAMLFHKPIAEFLPHVVVGYVFWTVIQGAIIDGAEVYIENEGLIKQLPAPITVHVYRLVFRQTIFLLHNMIIVVIVLAVFPKNWSFADLSFLPAIALIILNAFWITVVIGTLATRFRDIVPLTTTLVQLLFFITPIIWTPSSLPNTFSWQHRLIEVNPILHFIEIVRAPLLAETQHLYHWLVVLGITFVGWGLALTVLRNYRNRIPYWV